MRKRSSGRLFLCLLLRCGSSPLLLNFGNSTSAARPISSASGRISHTISEGTISQRGRGSKPFVSTLTKASASWLADRGVHPTATLKAFSVRQQVIPINAALEETSWPSFCFVRSHSLHCESTSVKTVLECGVPQGVLRTRPEPQVPQWWTLQATACLHSPMSMASFPASVPMRTVETSTCRVYRRVGTREAILRCLCTLLMPGRQHGARVVTFVTLRHARCACTSAPAVRGSRGRKTRKMGPFAWSSTGA